MSFNCGVSIAEHTIRLLSDLLGKRKEERDRKNPPSVV
jgi:hypothetical protein